MSANQTCPKCGGKMEKGKIYPQNLKTSLTFAKPAKDNRGLLTYAPKDRKEIVAYGCQECGYIELYIEK